MIHWKILCGQLNVPKLILSCSSMRTFVVFYTATATENNVTKINT